jgi:hypothetical protein
MFFPVPDPDRDRARSNRFRMSVQIFSRSLKILNAMAGGRFPLGRLFAGEDDVAGREAVLLQPADGQRAAWPRSCRIDRHVAESSMRSPNLITLGFCL